EQRDTAFVRRICWQRVHAEPSLRRIDIKSPFASSRPPQAGQIAPLPSRSFLDKSSAPALRP
ncbi:hypothetical protein, partial [Mesorhizobium sp.]|uniref:hypothetical protein n=1 Tax=Mesorhizobium sp. TaxID=1871066 RepID=UPI0025DC9A41